MRRAVVLSICMIAGLAGASPAKADGIDPAPVPVETPSGGGLGIGISIGTTGVGGELSVRPFGNLVLRAGGTWFALDHDFDVDDKTYKLKADMVSAGATVDWHAFSNGFRLSAGARYHNIDLSGAGNFTGTFEIGNNTYDMSQTGAIGISVKSSSTIAPYLGIGYDSTHFSDSRWALALDLGVIYAGKPTSTITAANAQTFPGLAADLAVEQKKLDDSVGKYGQFWPVAALTLKFRF
jgi:hypothetical protein